MVASSKLYYAAPDGGFQTWFPQIDRAHCALVSGWIRGIGLAVGARRPTVEQVRCLHRGDARCEFAGRWQR